MTLRAVVAAWVVTAALLAAAVAAMIVAAGPAPPIFNGAPIAVIGSSLMHNAVANDQELLLGDGRAHWRVGINGITQEDTAALLAHAIDEHAQVALVEANVLLFDLAKNRIGRCDQPAAPLRHAMKLLQLGLTDVYARLSGRPGELAEAPGIPEFETSLPVSEKQRSVYPLVIRGPCNGAALENLALQAHAAGTAIVLLVPPRSATADALLGPIQKQAIADHAQALAKTMGAALVIADTAWPDDEFVDGEHLNRSGRAHFIAALRRWWQSLR